MVQDGARSRLMAFECGSIVMSCHQSTEGAHSHEVSVQTIAVVLRRRIQSKGSALDPERNANLTSPHAYLTFNDLG